MLLLLVMFNNISSGMDVKDSCRLATTADVGLTYSNDDSYTDDGLSITTDKLTGESQLTVDSIVPVAGNKFW